MKRQSWTARFTYLPLAALAVANLVIVVSFWSSFSAEHAVVFQAVGGALAFIELTALVVASDAAARGEATKALVWRAVFAGVLCVNLIADFGALATLTAGDAEQRGAAVARYDRAEAREAEAAAEIARLRAQLETLGLDRPVRALEAELRPLAEQKSRYAAEGLGAPLSLERRIAVLESGIETARAIEAERRRHAEAARVLAEAGARPQSAHPQFEGLSLLMRAAGFDVTPDATRIGVGALVALVMKLVLVFGLWALSPRLFVQPKAEAQQPELKEPCSAAFDHRPLRRRRPRRHDGGARESDDLRAALSELETHVRLDAQSPENQPMV